MERVYAKRIYRARNSREHRNTGCGAGADLPAGSDLAGGHLPPDNDGAGYGGGRSDGSGASHRHNHNDGNHRSAACGRSEQCASYHHHDGDNRGTGSAAGRDVGIEHPAEDGELPGRIFPVQPRMLPGPGRRACNDAVVAFVASDEGALAGTLFCFSAEVAIFTSVAGIDASH